MTKSLMIASARKRVTGGKAFLKYRIFILNIAGPDLGPYAQMGEVEFLNAQGQDILIPGQVVTGQSSFYTSAYRADKLIDNDTSTKWTSAANVQNNSWVSFEFPTPKEITAFTISVTGDQGQRQPKDFRLEASNDNGATWTVLKAVTDQVNWTESQKRTYVI